MQERLNRLYEQYGYRKFKMSRFEDYDLYAQNRDFLRQDRIITFTDADGALKALKPDVYKRQEKRLPPDQTEYDLFRQFQSGY